MKICRIVSASHRSHIVPVMVRIIIRDRADPPGIQHCGEDHLQVLSYRHPFIPQIQVALHQLSPEQLCHTGRLDRSPDKTSVIQKDRKKSFQIRPVIKRLLHPVRLPAGRISRIRVVKNQPRHGDIRIFFLQCSRQPLIHVRIDPVVAVHKTQQRSFRMTHSFFPCGSKSSVPFVYGPDIGKSPAVVVADRRTAIRRSVVHQYYFYIFICLRQNTFHTASQHFFHAVNRHNYTDLFFHPGSCILLRIF